LKQNTEIIENKLKEVDGHCEILVNIMSLNLESMENGLRKLKLDYFVESEKDRKLMNQISIFVKSIEHCRDILHQNKQFG
jgi:hypothetical protein